MRVTNQRGQVIALFRGKSAQIQGTVIPEPTVHGDKTS
jgi:acyl-CoA thioesterase